jgi:hypothetical protein
VKTSGPVLTKVYQEVLLAAVAPLTPSPDHWNQVPSHLLMLVVSHCQVIHWLALLWSNLPLADPPKGDGSRSISTSKCIAKQSSTMAVKALRYCYDLQKRCKWCWREGFLSYS